MRVSAEGFFLVNLAMNFACLLVASRGILFIRWERILLSSVLGATLALVSERFHLPGWTDLPSACVTLALAVPLSRRNALGASARALIVLAVMERVARVIAGIGGAAVWTLPVCAVAGAACACAATGAFRSFPTYVRMRVRTGGQTRSFQALLDTGNIVTEAISGLSVLIADRRALGEIGPRTAERFVCYGAVGSVGEIGCVRPESLEYHNGLRWVRAPDMWLGIYPGVLRGGVHALAPGVLLRDVGRR